MNERLSKPVDAEINGEFVYHLGDALSTVRDVVDDEGDVIRSFEFDEYGNMLNSSGSGTASPKTWIGGLSVNDDRADSGLWNMGHRNYAGGVIGRFVSRDPIGHAGGLNLYAYPTNPVNFVDSDGLEPVTVIVHVKSAEISGMNNALGTNFSPKGLASLWQNRLNEFGIDAAVKLKEGFDSRCEDRSNKFVRDDEGFHVNLHFTDKMLNALDTPGSAHGSRARVSYRVIDEIYDASYPGSSSSFPKSRSLEMALYNTSMHEMTHGLGAFADHNIHKNHKGTYTGQDMKGCIMSPKMSTDPAYFEKLMRYGNDTWKKSQLLQSLFGR